MEGPQNIERKIQNKDDAKDQKVQPVKNIKWSKDVK